jgi:hypothetical protein
MHRILGLALATIAFAASGCVADEPTGSDEDQAALAVQPDTTVTLTIQVAGLEFGVLVKAASGNQICQNIGCNLQFPAGTQLTLSPLSTVDRTDCLSWTGWTGQCAGQGNPCVTVINSNITVNTTAHFIAGCVPE